MDQVKKKYLLVCSVALIIVVATTILVIVLSPQQHGGLSTFDPLVDESQEWELIQSFDEEKLKVEKYKSKRTHLTVVLGYTESPIVNGYFCLATEAFDDDGLPHTLEHLIFRGSEDYPYKEMLDNLATR